MKGPTKKVKKIQKEINKQLIIITISTIVMVISVIGVSLSAFVWTDNSTKNQGLIVGNMELAISSTSEPLGSDLKYPIPVEQESQLNPYTFTIKNNGNLDSIYKLKIIDETNDENGNPYTNNLDKQYIYINLSGTSTIDRTSLINYENSAIDEGVLKAGESKTYDLRLWLVNNAPNAVIGKEWHGKIAIENSQRNEWAEQERNLVEAIKNDNEILSNPNFDTNNTDNGLYIQEGDNTKTINGTATYYFRGQVNNNYVKFANNIWRIIRINEDTSIKLILDKKDSNLLSVNNIIGQTNGYTGGDASDKLNNWCTSNLTEYQNKIIAHDYDNIYGSLEEVYNNALSFVSNPTFIPNNNYKLNAKLGLLSLSEFIYSGNKNSYLNIDSNYLLMGSYNEVMWHVSSTGELTLDNSQTINAYARPVINLDNSVIASEGDGTKADPYIIN